MTTNREIIEELKALNDIALMLNQSIERMNAITMRLRFEAANENRPKEEHEQS